MPKQERPHFHARIEDLEALFAQYCAEGDAEGLDVLLIELSQRSTPRAQRLRDQVVDAIGAWTDAPEDDVLPDAPGENDAEVASDAVDDLAGATDDREQEILAERELPAITRAIENLPEDVLAAWTALEVLSPPTFLKPERLAGDANAVAYLRNGLPWSGRGETSRPSYRLFYQVVLGAIDMKGAVEKLLRVYGDKRFERPSGQGQAVLAVLMLDKQGRPIEEGSACVSSFAWGLPIAMNGDLQGLSAWPEHEKRLSEELAHRVLQRDDEGEARPVNAEIIQAAYRWLLDELDLPADLLVEPTFVVRTYQYYKLPGPPEPLLLNSFYLRDIAVARALFRRGKAPPILHRYLGAQRPPAQRDLLNDANALAQAVAPLGFPLARWPSNGGHALSLLQQAAVNLAAPVTQAHSILAVNGPPGTGKTTLLRDIAAGRICERAEAMAQFDDPEQAFTNSGQKLRAGAAWVHLYRLDPKLRGFEMLVASTNNKAVENVSAELPISRAAAPRKDLRYFKTLSDNLHEADTWGAIAAVLGNGSNRARFAKRLWWDKDHGLMTYLASATGTPQVVRIEDEQGYLIEERKPRIVTQENCPTGRPQALARWRDAKANFIVARDKVKAALLRVEAFRQAMAALPEARKKRQSHIEANEAARALLSHWDLRPEFWVRLFGLRAAREWRLAEHDLRAQLAAKAQTCAAQGAVSALGVSSLHGAIEAQRVLSAQHAIAESECKKVESMVTEARSTLGSRIVDRAFFEAEHEVKHARTPWLDDVTHQIRDDLFVQAMALHKAFADAAAKPLRHNLSAAMNAINGRSLGAPAKDALLGDLWSSLFLVVPVLSTTFASVDRMLTLLGPEAIGWLLVDEAGQALPQAAVGALMRARRAVIVGDPMQIEPVVMLPETLAGAVCRQFGVDPDRYAAPAASIQTLADAATPYSATFEANVGSRTVGVPLLVHRRCQEPMFGVSNAIAYSGQMVPATPKRDYAPIRDALGPSRWIDVTGGDNERWCPEEGDIVLRLLRALRDRQIKPDLYIVTPFVMVQQGMRNALLQSGILQNWVECDPWKWAQERVGTVHTVQGREAEAVIFVLGAQKPERSQTRAWAGARPNLLNVAVTRAQEVLYVVGNRGLWKEAGVFRDLHSRLPPSGQRPTPQNDD